MTDTYFGDEAFGDEAVAAGDTALATVLPTVLPTSLPTALSWTDERVELLRRLWIEGLSASRIAAELAGGVTRNAVIGKVHRMGLSGRVKAIVGEASTRARPAAVKPGPAARTGLVQGMAAQGLTGHDLAAHDLAARDLADRDLTAQELTAQEPAPTAMQDNGNPLQVAAPPIIPPMRSSGDTMKALTENVTIMDLRESMCRWPVGDPSSAEFRYCGSKAPIGAGPYCAHHSRMAYQPVQDRNRRRTA